MSGLKNSRSDGWDFCFFKGGFGTLGIEGVGVFNVWNVKSFDAIPFLNICFEVSHGRTSYN